MTGVCPPENVLAGTTMVFALVVDAAEYAVFVRLSVYESCDLESVFSMFYVVS
ncbi:MAG: hypothetical protein RLZZ319_711, partial [Actinomycetota bacterium]